MRHEQGPQLLRAFTHVGEVVDDDINAVHLVVGKHQAAIDDDQIVVGFDHGHVAADLAAAPERNDTDVGLGRGRGDG